MTKTMTPETQADQPWPNAKCQLLIAAFLWNDRDELAHGAAASVVVAAESTVPAVAAPAAGVLPREDDEPRPEVLPVLGHNINLACVTPGITASRISPVSTASGEQPSSMLVFPDGLRGDRL